MHDCCEVAMNVYVIYKFDDHRVIEERLDTIKKEMGRDISFFYFKPGKRAFWHRIARSKIKKCDMVVFFDNRDDYSDTNLNNIKWELKLAGKYKKRIVIFKKNNEKYAPQLYDKDYSELVVDHTKYQTRNVEDALNFFKSQAGWTVENNILNSAKKVEPRPVSNEDKHLLLEQYKIMIDTSEKLMERRQSMVSLYITICTALIAFIGASFAFGNLLITATITLLTGVIIIILCYNWRTSLGAYELNNEGKFEVINQIEKHLPADMFECEYRYNKMKGIRSYSAREKVLPLIFMFVGVALILLSGVLFIIK